MLIKFIIFLKCVVIVVVLMRYIITVNNEQNPYKKVQIFIKYRCFTLNYNLIFLSVTN